MRRLLITTLLLAAWLSPALAGDVGTTGNPLLRIPLGARPAAMGDAFTAMSGTADVIGYNPAALAALDHPSFTLHYQKRFLDLRVTSLQLGVPLPLGTLGAGLDYFSEGWIHETRQGLSTGRRLHSYSTRILLGYGLPIYPWLEAGMDLTWLSSFIAQEASAHSFTTDCGVRFPNVFRGLSGALVLKHLGTRARHETDGLASEQPSGVRLGLLYDAFNELPADLVWLTALDLTALRGGGQVLGAGSEIALREFYNSPLDVVFRGGCQFSSLETAHSPLTLGFGLVFQDFAIDYAFETFTDLGSVSRVSLTFQPRRLPGDSDGDGVIDPDDLCPETPPGAEVDERGCPFDSDGDTVFDGIDLCPFTLLGAVVDSTGCPLDNDGDGVFDGIDQCPGTPADARVDRDGCPLDSDGDKVFDGIDQCPPRRLGAVVERAGSPLDSDGDPVFDGIDQCPDTPPDTPVDKQGCPLTQVEYEFLETGLLRLQDINFASNQAVLKESSFAELDRIGNLLAKWNELTIEIGGHTDGQGTELHNQQLSEERAEAVRVYLLKHFPTLNADQLSSRGYGESQPIADNDTREGRSLNRRVEFRIISDGELKRVRMANWLE